MKRTVAGLALTMLGIFTAPTWAGIAAALQAPAQTRGAAQSQTTTWYFYTVKWGSQEEFLDLFQKNHYPVLKARMEAGYYSAVRTYRPRYHGDGRADWTFAVELVAREGVMTAPSEEDVIRKLYPDQVTFQREERRRFELLTAHWDVPLEVVDLDARRPSGR